MQTAESVAVGSYRIEELRRVGAITEGGLRQVNGLFHPSVAAGVPRGSQDGTGFLFSNSLWKRLIECFDQPHHFHERVLFSTFVAVEQGDNQSWHSFNGDAGYQFARPSLARPDMVYAFFTWFHGREGVKGMTDPLPVRGCLRRRRGARKVHRISPVFGFLSDLQTGKRTDTADQTKLKSTGTRI